MPGLIFRKGRKKKFAFLFLSIRDNSCIKEYYIKLFIISLSGKKLLSKLKIVSNYRTLILLATFIIFLKIIKENILSFKNFDLSMTHNYFEFWNIYVWQRYQIKFIELNSSYKIRHLNIINNIRVKISLFRIIERFA